MYNNESLFYFNVNKKEFNVAVKRNGLSAKTKWQPLNTREEGKGKGMPIYIKNISFGVCTHPFNTEGVSFKRNPFSIVKDNEYGIAFKGTVISHKDWENLATDDNPVDMATRKMMNRRGAEISYPFIVQRLKTEGLYELAKQSLDLSGINALLISRTLPKLEISNKHIYFVPMPIYAMSISPLVLHTNILFNQKQTVRSWSRHHASFDEDWIDKVS